MEIIKNSKKIIVAILVIIMIIATSPIILGANDEVVPVITPLQRAGEILPGQSLKFKITDNTEVSYVFYEWDRRLSNKPDGKYETDELEEGHSEYEYSITAPTALGLHELSIAAQDYYGNITYWMNIPYVVVDKLSGIVDNEKPKLTFNIPDEYPYNNSTIPQEMPITLRATDNQSGIYYIGYKWTRQIVQNDTGANLVFDEVANIKAPSEPGMWYLLTYTRDRSNNVSSAYATRVYVKETNYIELKDKINNLPELVEEDYTSESWKELQDIIAETNKMIADNKATQNQVNEQITKIDNAINNISLNKKEVNKDELTNYIKPLVSTDYEDESWANFERLVEIANNQTLQSEFDKKVEEVKAFSLQAKQIDTTKLDAIEANLVKLTESDYTSRSWSAIQTKIEDAKKQTLQSKFDEIVNEIDLSTLVKLPKILNINNNAQYKTEGQEITIEFETNMELYLWNPFTSGYTTAEFNENDVTQKIYKVVGQQNKYTITYTITAEDVEKGSISYVIKPVTTNNIEGKEVTGEISIKDYIEKIEITTEPKKQYRIDDTIDLTVGKITVTMASKKSEDIDMSNEKVTIEGFDTSSLGTKLVSVNYEGKTATFEITVDKKDIIAKEINVTPLEVTYDGTQKAVEIKKLEGMGEVTSIKYEKDGTSSTEAPKDAGEYIIRVSIGEGEKYKARSNFAVGTLTIKKADPTYTVPTGLTAVYGQMLAQVKGLTEGFSFEQAPIAPVGDVGDHTEFTLKYTPSNTNNYNVVTKIPVTVKVEKADPTYEVPTGLTAVYGQTLADVTLQDGFTFEVGEGKELNQVKVGNVGSNKFTVTYTPDNTNNYNVVNNIEVEIEVTQAEAPKITFPTASRITYGQTLGNSELTGGSTEYGTFAWVNLSAIPEVNNTKAYKVRFTPNENTIANYKEITDTIGTVQVEVGKANAPKIEFPTASKLNYGSPLAFSKLTGGSTEYGTFAWKEPNTVPTVNNTGYEVVFTPNENTIANYEEITNSIAIVQIEVAKASAPVIIFPTATKITYGQTLADSELTGGSMALGFGTFKWTNPSIKPTVDNSGYEVTFVPNEDIMANYEEVTNTTAIVQIEVEKANAPEITFPTASKVTYGQTLGDSTLEGGSTEYGTFAWTDATIKPTVDNSGYEVVFTPNADAIANYKEITDTTKNILVEVEKANAPEITFPTASKLTYGLPLAFSKLTGGSIEYGTFAWKEPNTVPTVNNEGYEVIFTPNEETKTNYEGITIITKTIEIEVEKAKAPTITFPTASKITYGQTLEASTLEGGSTQFGTFKWTNPSIKPTVDNSGYEVTFVPNEDIMANYEEVTNTTAIVQIEVEKANAPEITFPTASKVTYGQTLGDSTLEGGSTEYGTFAWVNKKAIPQVNNTEGYKVIFTPNENTIANYEEIKDTVQRVVVVVEKAVPTYEVPTGLTAVYRQTLGDVTLPERFTFNDDLTTPVGNVGSNKFTVTYTPNDTNNYNVVNNIEVEITVTKAVAPVIIFPTASKITYGDTLGASTLEGGSTEYGTFAWSDGAIKPTVNNIGYEVVFTPNENTKANYEEVTNTTAIVQIAVEKANAPEIIFPTASKLNYGSPLAFSELTGGSIEYGTFAWKDKNTVPTVNNTGYEVEFTPNADTIANYKEITKTIGIVQIEVAKAAAPEITFPTATKITYGQTLADSKLQGGSILFGTFAWSDATIKPEMDNTTGYEVIFTPNEDILANYEEITDTTKNILVEVGKAVAPEITFPTASKVIYGQTLGDSVLEGGSIELGTFEWLNPSAIPEVNNAKGYNVVFTPSEEAQKHYEGMETKTEKVIVEVEPAESTYTGTTEFTAIYGQTLSDIKTQLPTELAFKLEEGQELTDISVGNVGDNTFTAIYTPIDTNYKAVEVEVTVKVSQGTPTYTGATEFTAIYGDTLADVTLEDITSEDGTVIGKLTFKLEEGQELTDISVGSVGDHTFTAIYTPTDTNYKAIEVSLTIKVGQATYDMSGVKFEGIKVKYDGQPHTIEITGTLPEGLTVNYENNTIINVGKVEAIAKFEFNDLLYAINYIKPDDMKATIEIEAVEPTYTGKTEFTAEYGDTLADVILPDVTSEDGTVIGKLAFKLEEGQELIDISVGDVGDNTFTAIYTPTDTNYKAVEVEVTIKVTPKSIREAQVTTTAQDTYEGQTIKAPEIKSVVLDNHILTKNIDYKISRITYALYDATTQITGEYTEEKPIKTGVYKVKTTLQGIGNYTGTKNKYDIIEIMEVEISDIDIKPQSPLKTEYKYGEKFDLTGWKVTIIYNNGNENTITLEKAIKEGIITEITYEPETIGEQNVNIVYDGNSKFDYKVNVKDYITEIKVKTLPTNIVYKVGDTFDTTNMEIVAVKASEKEVNLNNDSINVELFKDNVKVEENALNEEGRYSVRLSYTDGYKDNFTYGDTFTTEFTIVVTAKDTTDKRVIVLNGSPKVEIEVGTLEYEDEGVSIYNVDNSPLVGDIKFTTKITKGDEEVGKIDTTDLGATYKITYIVEGAQSITREVTIVDTTAPEITLSEDIKTTEDVRVDKNENETVINFTKGKAEFNLSTMVEASDNYDKIVDVKYLVTYNSKPVSDMEKIGEQAGEYIVTYTAEDKSGNIAESLVVKFIVLDYPPIIYYLDENGIKIEIKEGKVYNDYLTIMCDKENVTIYYKKDDEEEKEYQQGDILRDGTYTIRGIEGQYISSAEKTFTIDTIEPEVKEINVVDKTITFADPSDVYKATLTSGDGSHIIIIKDVENNIDRIDENGIYHITDEDNRISRVYVLRVEDANGNQIRLPKFKLPELKTN